MNSKHDSGFQFYSSSCSSSMQSNQQRFDGNLSEVRHNLQELVDLASISVAPSKVLSVPGNPIELIRDVIANDVILLDLFESRMRIVHAQEHNATAVGSIDEHFVVKLWNWQSSVGSIHVQMDDFSFSVGIFECE